MALVWVLALFLALARTWFCLPRLWRGFALTSCYRDAEPSKPPCPPQLGTIHCSEERGCTSSDKIMRFVRCTSPILLTSSADQMRERVFFCQFFWFFFCEFSCFFLLFLWFSEHALLVLPVVLLWWEFFSVYFSGFFGEFCWFSASDGLSAAPCPEQVQISTCYNNTLRPTLRPFATRAWSVGAAIVGPDRTQKLVNVRGWFKRNLGCFNLKLCFGLGLTAHVGRKHSIRICGLWWTIWVLLGSTVCGVKVAPRIIAPSVRNYGLEFRV